MKKLGSQVELKYLIMTMAGLLVLLLGRGLATTLNIYPAYIPDYGIGPEFQYYTLNTFYGASIDWGTEEILFTGYRLPVFAIAGYVLIAMGFGKMKERSKVFVIGSWMSVAGLVMTLVINLFPFLIHNVNLCYIVMCLGIAGLGIELSVGYFFVCGVCDILSGTAFKTDRTTLALTWFVTLVCRIVVFVTTWIQLANLTLVYNMILLWLWIFFIYTIWKLRQFIIGEIEIEG